MQVNGAVQFKNNIFVRNLHENCAQLTLKANVFFRSGSQMRFVCVELINLFFCLFQHDGISAVDWALSRISDPETGLPRGWISDLEVFAQKSRDRIFKSRDQVIIWISDLVTGYALTTSYPGHCSKKFQKYHPKSWGMPSLRIRTYATSSCDKNLHFTTIIFVNTALSYLTLHPRKFMVVKSLSYF